MFHIAPTTERNRIRQHGLQSSLPAFGRDSHRPYESSYDWGVYAWLTVDQAWDWMEYMYAAHPELGDYDIWVLPPVECQPDRKDELLGAVRITGSVDATLYDGPENRAYSADPRLCF